MTPASLGLTEADILRSENVALMQKLGQYKALFEWTQVAFATSRWEDLGYQVLHAAMELAEAETGTYLIRIGTETKVRISARRRKGDHGIRIDGDGIVDLDKWGQQALNTNKIVRVTNHDAILQSVTGTFLSSSMYVPIKTEKANGIIWLGHTSAEAFFTQEQEELLAIFARPACVSLENILLLEKHKKASETINRLYKRLNVTQKLVTALHSSDNLQEVLEKILDAIVHALGFDYATVSLIDRNTNTISTLYGRTKNRQEISLAWIPESHYPLTDKDIIAYVARENKSEIIQGWDDRLNAVIYNKYH